MARPLLSNSSSPQLPCGDSAARQIQIQARSCYNTSKAARLSTCFSALTMRPAPQTTAALHASELEALHGGVPTGATAAPAAGHSLDDAVLQAPPLRAHRLSLPLCRPLGEGAAVHHASATGRASSIIVMLTAHLDTLLHTVVEVPHRSSL